jgi:hypothetical protein
VQEAGGPEVDRQQAVGAPCGGFASGVLILIVWIPSVLRPPVAYHSSRIPAPIPPVYRTHANPLLAAPANNSRRPARTRTQSRAGPLLAPSPPRAFPSSFSRACDRECRTGPLRPKRGRPRPRRGERGGSSEWRSGDRTKRVHAPPVTSRAPRVPTPIPPVYRTDANPLPAAPVNNPRRPAPTRTICRLPKNLISNWPASA